MKPPHKKQKITLNIPKTIPEGQRVFPGYDEEDALGLPDEIEQLILCKLDPRELVRCSYVCRRWKRLASDNLVWMLKFAQSYPSQFQLKQKEILLEKWKHFGDFVDFMEAMDLSIHSIRQFNPDDVQLQLPWKQLFIQEHLNNLLDSRIVSQATSFSTFATVDDLYFTIHFHLARTNELLPYLTSKMLEDSEKTSFHKPLPSFPPQALSTLLSCLSSYMKWLFSQPELNASMENITIQEESRDSFRHWLIESYRTSQGGPIRPATQATNRFVELFEEEGLWCKYFTMMEDGIRGMKVIINPCRMGFLMWG